jgi:hypothetical protein
LLHATIFPGSEFLFSQEPVSKLPANDGKHGQCWSNCAAANASRVLGNRTQGNWLSPFAQPHLISPAKNVFQIATLEVIQSTSRG